MTMPMPRFKRIVAITTIAKIDVQHRVSIGLIGISLGLMSLAVSIALFSVYPSAALLLSGNFVTLGSPSTATDVTLAWTAPGDDGVTGQAASYDIRQSTNPITPTNFSQAQKVANVPLPSIAGAQQTMTVTGLSSNTTYYFSLKTSDAVGNTSEMSNIATATTATLNTACLPHYTCGPWSACRSGKISRSCIETTNCAKNIDEPLTTQTCTGSGGGTIIPHRIVVGGAPNSRAALRVINPDTKKVEKEFYPFGSKARGGMRLAVGNLTGTGQSLIAVGAEGASDSTVRIFTLSGRLITSFRPYPAALKNGTAVAMADVDGNGRDELITAPDRGAGQIRVWTYLPSSKKFVLKTQFFAFARSTTTGFSLAAGDMNLDGKAEVAVTNRRSARTVLIFHMKGGKMEQAASLKPYPVTISSGITMTMGDIYGDGRRELIVTGGPGYWSQIKFYDIKGRRLMDYLPTVTTYRGGMSLAAFDVNSDGRDELVTTSYGSGDSRTRIFRYNGISKKIERTDRYYVFPTTMNKGLRLAGA